MKKSLFAAALMLVAGNVMASQSRVGALGGSRQVADDFVDMFSQPSNMWSGDIKDQVLIENGTGGFLMTADESSKYGMYFGYQPSSLSLYTGMSGVTTTDAIFSSVDKPLNLFYGRDMAGMKWGFNLYYANSKTEVTTPSTKSFTGITAGVEGQGWNANVTLGLGGKISDDTTTETIQSTSNIAVKAEYDLSESVIVYGDYVMAGAKSENTATLVESAVTTMNLGVERKVAKEAATFFYGARLFTKTTEEKVAGTKREEQSLPLYFGVEADATSWLVLRGSVTQAVLIDSNKTAGGVDSLSGTPTVAAGAGLRLGNFLLDGGITAGTTGGALNTTNLMSNVALTYNF